MSIIQTKYAGSLNLELLRIFCITFSSTFYPHNLPCERPGNTICYLFVTYFPVNVFQSQGQALRLYHLLEPSLQEGKSQTYEILMRESSFSDLRGNDAPTRETFMTILSDIQGFLIRATHHQKMRSVTMRDLSMDTAIPSPTNLGQAPMVENCRCPEGYNGLSCQRCAQGYLRVADGPSGLGRCVRCNCNGHATSCDPETGRCLVSLHLLLLS